MTKEESVHLTRKELEVLKGIATGLQTKQIAETVHCSVKTVEKHRTHIMQKLDLRGPVKLCLFALRRGLVELQDE
jgi:two-component system, LuxR family, secretion system response regulator SsrB